MHKSLLLKVLATPALLLVLSTTTYADTGSCCADAVSCDAGGYSDCCSSCCSDCCCAQGGLFVIAEATFFRFHDAGGVEDGAGDDGEFDFEASPRITLGYANCNGRGVRVRYWDYDHDTRSDDGGLIDVDTYNVDFELFQVLSLPCRTTLDMSVGIRYNDFFHFFEDGVLGQEQHSFDGIGGMFALAGRVDLNCNLSAYARFREVIMMDDAQFDTLGGLENDVTRPIPELGFGLLYRSCNLVAHAGVEWQNWGNYTSNGLVNLDGEPHDIGFAGFVVGAGLNY